MIDAGLANKTVTRATLRGEWIIAALDRMALPPDLAGPADRQLALGIQLGSDHDHNFHRLQHLFELSEEDTTLVECLAALETPGPAADRLRSFASDDRFEHGPSPMVDTLVTVLTAGDRTTVAASLASLSPGAPLRRYHLVQVDDKDRSLRYAPIRLAHGLLGTLLGERPHVTGCAWSRLSAEATASSETEVRVAAHALRQGGRLLLVVAGLSRSGQEQIVMAAARHLGQPVLRTNVHRLATAPQFDTFCGQVARDARLTNAVVLIEGLTRNEHELPHAWGFVHAAIDALAAEPIALAVTTDVDDLNLPSLSRPIVRIKTKLPSEDERAALWRQYLPNGNVEAIARAYALSPSAILDAAHTAQVHAAARSGQASAVPTEEDARTAVRAVIAAGRIFGHDGEYKPKLTDLVLSSRNHELLRELMLRVRHRRRVIEELDFAQVMGRQFGVSALFHGAPGTGKSMAAYAIANELGVECLRVDVSQVLSKWVGETEKQLAHIFDTAEQSDALLLFDEADALFTERTDVRSSNDRYANVQLTYLLQRLESFPGLVALTTNRFASIDAAFMRRLSVQVQFDQPGEEARLLLWRQKLPEKARAADVRLEPLAKQYKMTGARIRNAAIRAAFYAADTGTLITQRYLLDAIAAEYRGAGWTTPSTLEFLE